MVVSDSLYQRATVVSAVSINFTVTVSAGGVALGRNAVAALPPRVFIN